jgi:hypothetical protein
MRYIVEYDTEVDGSPAEIGPEDVPVLGLEPVEVSSEGVATYEFPDGTSESEIAEDLEGSAWCWKAGHVDDGAPGPA